MPPAHVLIHYLFICLLSNILSQNLFLALGLGPPAGTEEGSSACLRLEVEDACDGSQTGSQPGHFPSRVYLKIPALRMLLLSFLRFPRGHESGLSSALRRESFRPVPHAAFPRLRPRREHRNLILLFSSL